MGVGEILLVLAVFFGILLLVSFRRWPNFFSALGNGFKEFVKQLRRKK